jgi:hyperosmotically inducible periplasmic protein
VTRARLVAAVVALVVLCGGCRTFTGRSVGRWVDDRSITTSVKRSVAAMRLGAGNHVQVDTYEGVVYLSGVVESDDVKRRVEVAARRVDEVEQVVPNLQIRRSPSDGLASLATDGNDHPRRVSVSGHSLEPIAELFPGFARIEGDPVARSRGPFVAYDQSGHAVATIYEISMREMAEAGVDGLEAKGRPIDHVTIYPVSATAELPDAQYHVVLWHVTASEAAALR